MRYDYIIIGAGSSGCVLANRLSADPGTRVLLLESGPVDRNPMLRMPGGLLEVFSRGGYHWEDRTVPQAHLNHRELTLYSGRTLGGSSSVNGMLHIRGSASDFDRWAAAEGGAGWRYAAVLPYFKQTEHSSRGEAAQRGFGGELEASDPPADYPTLSLVRAFEQAAMGQGIPRQADFCSGEIEGVGRAQATIRRGRRHSAASAFLKPVRRRDNLDIVTHATVETIDIDRRVARGVSYERGGRRCSALASREVIVSAGALRSPALLQRSGMGPPSLLESLGIEVIQALSGVGENLHDHPTVKIQYACERPVTLSGLSVIRQMQIGLQWLLFKRGLGSWNHFDGNLFTRSSAQLTEPDLQIQLIPLLAHGIELGVGDRHGITFVLCLLAEKSRGSVRIQSRDAGVAPLFDLNFMACGEDFTPLRSGISLCRKLAGSEAWQGLLGEELLPGPAASSDAQYDEFIRNTVETDYHYGGSCRMGRRDDPTAVVDSELRVVGIQRLRVADASVMPLPLHGNTNASCVMIGAHLAHKLRRDYG